MRTHTKRGLSFLLALAMVFTLVLGGGITAYASDLTLAFDQSPYLVTASAADQTVNIKLSAAAAFNCCVTGGTLSAASGLEITDILNETGASMWGEYNTANGQWTHFMDPVGMEDVNITDIVTVVVKVPGGTAAGDYTVTISDLQLGYAYGTENHSNNGNSLDGTNSPDFTATIRVTDAAPPTQGYELYYTLNQNSDSDTDYYSEYNPGDTVTATVYLKSNLADTLQAFDLYITNDANLTYTSYTSDNGTRIASGTAASTATSQHIQAVGADKDHPINVALPAGTGVEIAEITFTVSGDVVYNTGYDITITAASNIAVENTPDSFTPDRQTVSSSVLGVETLKTYTVSYNDNVDTETITVPGDQTKQHNVALTLSNDEPARTGYDFKGWSKTEGKVYSSDTDIDYAKGASFTENADTALYALWQPHTHKVEWKSQDGSSILETDAAVDYGAVLSYDSAAPTKAADAQYTYTFAGWSTTANTESGAAANTFTMGDADMVLYAAFSKDTNKYTVTWYNQAGDSALETDSNVLYNSAPAYDSAAPTKPADDTYNYTFAGWATSANQETGSAVGALPVVTGNADYYAAFSKTYIDYTITYNKGDHAADSYSVPAAKTDAHYGVAYDLPAAATAADGYTFTGWSDGTNTYAAGASYTPAGTATLTATYSENHYNVVYENNGGTGVKPGDEQNVAYTDTIVIADGTGLVNNGYTFAGWNTAANGSGTPYSAGASVSKLSAVDGATVILYAQWTAADYTITYDYDDATTVPSNPAAYDVDDLPITLTQPTKTGYDFNGWTIEVKSGETGNVEIDATDSNKLIAGTWGNLTVKANWTPGTVNYTVKHWQQNIDNDSYTEVTDDAQTLTGTTGTQTNAAAKTYTGFTAQAFSQDTIAANGSTVIDIYYNRDTHTVTYQYTNDPAISGAPVVPAQATYKYGQKFNVEAVPSLDHYSFTGWSLSGEQTMGTENIVITGTWSEISYTIKFWNLENGETGNTVLREQTYTESTQGSITVPEVPAKTWYDANGWTAYTLFSDSVIDVYPQYTEHSYTITFKDKDGNDLADQGTDNTFTVTDKSINAPAVPARDGYNGVWPAFPTDTAADASVQPVYTPVNYTITFETDGGTAIAEMTYNIESTDTLPAATGKANFAFDRWKVTTADGNWAADSTINGGTAVTGKYGNVTLTAQWTQNLNYAVQEYKYAPAGYRLLIIDASGAGDGNVYTYDGAAMYYTTDANYQIGTSTGVFYTLVEVNATALTDAQVGKIAAAVGAQQTITYDGDVNGDGTVNIADANAIYQMVVNTGSYYGTDQLTVAQRLAADMVKATDNAEHRGSIEDVNAVVAIINGTN